MIVRFETNFLQLVGLAQCYDPDERPSPVGVTVRWRVFGRVAIQQALGTLDLVASHRCAVGGQRNIPLLHDPQVSRFGELAGSSPPRSHFEPLPGLRPVRPTSFGIASLVPMTGADRMAALTLPAAFSANSHHASPRATFSAAAEGFDASSLAADAFNALSLPLARVLGPRPNHPGRSRANGRPPGRPPRRRGLP